MVAGVVAAIAALGIGGVWLMLSGLGRGARGKVASGGGRTLGGGFLAAIAAVAGLFGVNLRTYDRLTVEKPVAVVTLAQTGPQAFEASLLIAAEGDEATVEQERVYSLRGDSVRLEARVVKLKPQAVIAGADTLYRLDQISGRYDDADLDPREEQNAFNLYSDIGDIDLTELPLGLSEQIIRDVKFGSGAFAPMVDGAQYEFRLTEDAMIVRGYNDIGRAALSESA